jgi:hypothetical protein
MDGEVSDDPEADINPFERRSAAGAAASPIRIIGGSGGRTSVRRVNEMSFSGIIGQISSYSADISFFGAVKLLVLGAALFSILLFMSETVGVESTETEIEAKTPQYVPTPVSFPVKNPSSPSPSASPTEDSVKSEQVDDLDDDGAGDEDDANFDSSESGGTEDSEDTDSAITDENREDTDKESTNDSRSIISYLQYRSFVAVGDSLTKGKYVVDEVTKSHPYTKALSTFFVKKNTTVLERGSHGETAEKLVARIDSVRSDVIRSTKSGKLSGGAVGVLTGNRDLLKTSSKGKAEYILAQIIDIHRRVHNFSSVADSFVYTLAFQIPQSHLNDVREAER